MACAATVLLGVAGAAIALVSAAVGGRFPLEFADPLWEFARPRWMSGDFERTVCWLVAPSWAENLAPSERSLQFLPLVGWWAVLAIAIGWRLRVARRAVRSDGDSGAGPAE